MVTLKKRLGGFTIVEVLIVLAIVGVMLASLVFAISRIKEAQRKNQARNELNYMANAIETTKQYRPGTLRAITGSWCSGCSCRTENGGPSSAQCISNWNNARSRLSINGLDISHLDVDPWGSTYYLDENEGEFPTQPCNRDMIVSLGPDGTWNTSDDIVRYAPLRIRPAGC